MTKILFFAQTRELIGKSQIELDIDTMTIDTLIDHLSQKGQEWRYALQEKDVLCAVNKKLVNHSHVIYNCDEVAFFPPVTGG